MGCIKSTMYTYFMRKNIRKNKTATRTDGKYQSTKKYQIRVKIFITHQLTSKTLFLFYLLSRVKTAWRFSSPARMSIFKRLQLWGAVTFYCLDFIVCERLLLLYWMETRAVCGIRLETKMYILFHLRWIIRNKCDENHVLRAKTPVLSLQ
jgi:hypothetical protein